MTESSITTLVGEEVTETNWKCFEFINGKNGYMYAIPSDYDRVVKFNPLDKSLVNIGPNLGDAHWKWKGGVLADDGRIYCAPRNGFHILQIDTSNDQVSVLDKVILPQTGSELWGAGVLGNDGMIYFMPDTAKRILRFNPFDRTASSVGNDIGIRRVNLKYGFGTVLGNNGCVYCIPHNATHIVKYDPRNPITTITLGTGTREKPFKCTGAVLGSDGCIYSINTLSGQILRLDTASDTYTWIEGVQNTSSGNGWGNPCIGADSCIYWPPVDANRVLKLNLEEQKASLVGDDLGEGGNKWYGTDLSHDGFIFCVPHQAKKVLQIDTRPINLLHKSITGGINDSPKDAVDRLGYHIYAEGLCEVARSVESPITSLCIALFGPWGSGKTFVWELSKGYLESVLDPIKEEVRKEMDERPATKLEKNISTTFANWCGVAHTINRYCCCCLCCCFGSKSALKEEEKIVLTMILTSWLGLPIFIIVFVAQTGILSCIKLCIYPILKFFCCEDDEERVDEPEHIIEPAVYNREEQEKVMRNIDNNPEIPTCITLLSIFCCLCGRREKKSSSDKGDVEMNFDDNPTKKANDNLRWRDVSNVIFGETDLYSIDRGEPKKGFMGAILGIQLLILTGFQFLCKTTRKIYCGQQQYEINQRMTKYIFVEFNAWVYSGTDSLWAKLLEELWTNVEKQCGKMSVRLHRSSIRLSEEENTDDIDTRRRKRTAAMLKLATNTSIAFLFGITSFVLIIIFAMGHVRTLSTLSFTPFLYFISIFARKVLPDLCQSRGTRILKQVRSFETHDRPDFSQKTGFMGEVEKEVKYFFDFLRTTYIVDDDLKMRRPIRLAVFVDDLDRCPKGTIMKVLEAVILLLVDAPITCWLAIDSRLVVASIEDHFGERFTKGGLDGYQYLEKIVQLPFCIPDLEESVKKNFLLKTLESSELTPLRVYNRIKFLGNENVKDISNVFSPIFLDTIETEETAYQKLISVLTMMVNQNYFKNQIAASNRAVRSPEEVLRAVENRPYRAQSSGDRQLNDQFLHYISSGIEIVLDRLRKRLSRRNSEESDLKAAYGNSDQAYDGNGSVSSNLQLTVGTFDSNGSVAGGSFTSGSKSNHQLKLNTAKSFREINGYQNLFKPMASPEERDWFVQYAKYFVGKPRKMKRILNSHMVSRYIASKMNPKVPLNSRFYKNLLKFTILLEQWPYRMAWLFIVVENLEQELYVNNTIEKKDKNLTSTIGESLISLAGRMLEKESLPLKRYGQLSLMNIYYHVVQILMHSPDDSNIHLKRDADSQLFEQLLLDDGDSKLKVKDISVIEEVKGLENNLRPYAFNLQRHMIENITHEIDNCMLLSRKNGKIEQLQSREGDFFVSYKKKSSFFDIHEQMSFQLQNSESHHPDSRRESRRVSKVSKMSLQDFYFDGNFD